MITLFNDLLNLSVIESKNLVKFEPFPVEPLVEFVSESARASYPEKQIEVTQDVRLPEIKGDQRLIEQVVSNLFDNACKYTDKQSIRIKVSCFELEGRAHLVVSDNGPGIPKEHLQRIFERFYRVDSSRETSRGTGLGLSIVKHIVAKHHGKIWAESEGLDTSFIVQLPLN